MRTAARPSGTGIDDLDVTAARQVRHGAAGVEDLLTSPTGRMWVPIGVALALRVSRHAMFVI